MLSSQGLTTKKEVISQSLSPGQVDRERTIEQTMEVLPHGTRRLAAQLSTPIGFESLWSVLTSYERLHEFIPNLDRSDVENRKGNEITLRQIGSQKFLGFKFSAEVRLKLIEYKNEGFLRFSMLQGDFRRFEGSWSISNLPNQDGSSLVYELTVQGCLGMPVSLIENRLREDLTNNLLAVEKAAIDY